MAIDIGIPEKQHAKIAEALSRMLAHSYILYLKTHNFHWNTLDLVAERIRALGYPAPGSYKRCALTSSKEEEGVPAAGDMIP